MRLAIISTPRSGNTWLRRIFAGLYGLKPYAVHCPEDLEWGKLPPRCVVQLHWHKTPELSALLAFHGFRVVTIARHPLDVLISILHFASHESQTAHWLAGEGGDEVSVLGRSPASREFFDYASGPRAKALLSVTPEWWSSGDVMKVRYEDLVSCPLGSVEALCRDLGTPHHDVSEVLSVLTLEKLQAANTNQHFWKGSPGLWRSVVPSKIASSLAEIHAKVFSTLGYRFDPLPDLEETGAEVAWSDLLGGVSVNGQEKEGPFISYAQNFEDVMLWRALKHVANGFYIDIGAQHPRIDSVSRAFYERGWRGIHVEPTACYARLLTEDRPEDVVIEAAVGKDRRPLKFFEISGTGWSTGDSEIAENHRRSGHAVQEKKVPCILLADLFRSCEGRQVHWLKIDVEGLEKDVLSGWAPADARPWIVVVESTRPETRIETHAQWENLILDLGYQFVYFDGLNRFYVSETKPDLKAAFRSGPNLSDDFVFSEVGGSSFCFLLKNKFAERERQLIAQKSSEIKRMESSLAEVRGRAAAQEARAVAAESRAVAQAQRAVAAEARAVGQEQRAVAAEARAAGQEQRAMAAEALCRGLENKHKVATAEIARLNQASRHWHAVADSANSELHSVYASQSWRITKPLRVVHANLLRIFKSFSPLISRKSLAKTTLPKTDVSLHEPDEDLSRLSSHARRIYADLKVAMHQGRHEGR